jgi:hypothetical protein
VRPSSRSDDGTLLALAAAAAFVGSAVVVRAAPRGSSAGAVDRRFLSVPVRSHAQARAFLKKLVDADLDFHLEDDPSNIIVHATDAPLFTEAEIPEVRARVAEVFTHYRGDPFEWLIELINRRNVPRIWQKP